MAVLGLRASTRRCFVDFVKDLERCAADGKGAWKWLDPRARGAGVAD
jgi:hypothetical protein